MAHLCNRNTVCLIWSKNCVLKYSVHKYTASNIHLDYSEGKLRWAVKKTSKEKKYYRQKIHSHLSYFSKQSSEELGHFYRGISLCLCVCLCKRNLPPVSSVTFSHLPSVHYFWSAVMQPVLRVGRSKQVVVTRSRSGLKGEW